MSPRRYSGNQTPRQTFGSRVNGCGQRKVHELMAKDTDRSKLKQQIDENLKRVYDDALADAVPDRFKQLLDQLRKQDEARGAKQ